MADLRTLGVVAENGSFTFPIVDQTARDLAQAAKDAAEGASSPIQRIVSDSSNYVFLRDLASGIYILYGYFRPYNGAASRLAFDNVLTCVAADSTESHILALTTVNSKVDFITIAVDSTQASGFAYTRTNISLMELNGLSAKVGDTGSLTTTKKDSLVAATNEVAGAISQLQQDVADLKYVPIDITSISNNVGTVELGATVESVTITWAVNKAPKSQTVEGEAVDAAARSKTLSGLSVTAAKTFTVTATDERDATDTATTKINFYNGVYYGALASGVVPDSAAILALTRKLQSGRGVTINYTPADGKRPSYACPSRYGTPKIVIGGFEYAWTKLTAEPIDFTNGSGYTEKYDVWQHPQDVTAAMTITVS